MKKRVPVSAPQAGLQNPFASLDLEGLPPGRVDEPNAPAVRKGRVVLRREKSQRGGKTVVVISDFEPQWTGGQIADLATKARKACGCGGTVREREIELQGDQPARVREFLEGEGFRVAGV